MRALDLMQSHFVQGRRHLFHVRTPRGDTDGDRPCLILVHGLGVSSRYMAPAAVALHRRFRVLVPDLPGFGKSSKPRQALDLDGLADALAEWMDCEGLSHAHLAANSLGCQTLVHFAVRHPGAPLSVTLQGPTFDPTARSTFAQVIRWLRAGAHEPLSLNWVILRDYLDSRTDVVLRTLSDALRDDLTSLLPAVHVPVMVVRGARDTIASQAWVEHVAALLPQGRLVTVPHAGHALNYSAPHAFATVLESFIHDVEGCAGDDYESPCLHR